MTQDYLSLEIDATFESGAATGIFEFGPADEGKLQIEEGIRTGFLVENVGDGALSILKEFLADGAPLRQGFFVDVGAGTHYFEINFQCPGDTPKSDGSVHQWGSTADDTVLNEQSATGAGPIQQMQVFNNYLRTATIDSQSPARFSFGEYSSSGIMDESQLDVVLESPTAVLVNDEPSRFDGSFTAIAAQGTDFAADKTNKRG